MDERGVVQIVFYFFTKILFYLFSKMKAEDQAEIINFLMNNYYRQNLDVAMDQLQNLANEISKRNQMIADLHHRLDLANEIIAYYRDLHENQVTVARRLGFESENEEDVVTDDEDIYELLGIDR